jgi:hypothetical protein
MCVAKKILFSPKQVVTEINSPRTQFSENFLADGGSAG